jgi:hypothetical protein
MSCPEGQTATGSFTLYPVWRGAGGVRTVPPAGLLRRRVERVTTISLRGLRPARYGIDLALELRAGESASARDLRRTLEVTVREPPAVTRLLLPVD